MNLQTAQRLLNSFAYHPEKVNPAVGLEQAIRVIARDEIDRRLGPPISEELEAELADIAEEGPHV